MRIYKTRRRRAFSLLEVSIGNALLGVLMVVTSSGIVSMGRIALRQQARARLEEEADLAATFLAEDLAGCLPDGASGSKGAGLEVGRRVVGSTELQICFDGGTYDGIAQWGTPDRLIRYYQSGSNLIRYDSSTGLATTVAMHLTTFTLSDGTQGIQAQISYLHRKEVKTTTLIFARPS